VLSFTKIRRLCIRRCRVTRNRR